MTNQGDPTAIVSGRWLDEVEQLRTSLESALEENARLAEDRDRLLRRVAQLSSQLHELRENEPRQAPPPPLAPAELIERQTQTEEELRVAFEELRVAFEELQVLTEELEVANTSLHQTNLELDARVDERTRQIRDMNAALRTTEGSLRKIADLVPDLLWRSDAAGNADWFNQRWCDYTGQEAAEPLGQGWAEALHPIDRPIAIADWRRAVETGTPCQQLQRIRDAQGNYRWFLMRAEPMRDEGGATLAWYATCTDVHEQRTAMEALQQSELRFRTLIEGMPQLVWRAVDGGRWTWSSPQWTAFTGQEEVASHGLGWLEMFHPDDRDAALTGWAMAQQAGSLEIEGRIFHAAEGRYRHFRTRALAVRDGERRIVEWLGTSTDVDDILELQAQQQVLVSELQHRTRNLMAVVQAITARTIDGSDSLESFRLAIADRFAALARVQSLLSRRDVGTRVAFDALVREEILAHVPLDVDGKGEQVVLSGPTGIPLRSATVQTLALAIHELATNAVKYGALSRPEGRLDIRWDVSEPAPGERRLLVDWRERGVSDAPGAGGATAQGSGYGRELIEEALPYQLNARTTFAFEPEGVHCTIDVGIPAEG